MLVFVGSIWWRRGTGKLRPKRTSRSARFSWLERRPGRGRSSGEKEMTEFIVINCDKFHIQSGLNSNFIHIRPAFVATPQNGKVLISYIRSGWWSCELSIIWNLNIELLLNTYKRQIPIQSCRILSLSSNVNSYFELKTRESVQAFVLRLFTAPLTCERRPRISSCRGEKQQTEIRLRSQVPAPLAEQPFLFIHWSALKSQFKTRYNVYTINAKRLKFRGIHNNSLLIGLRLYVNK